MTAGSVLGTDGRTLRYVVTIVAGFAVDFTTALLLARLLDLSLPLSAAVGFAVALGFNYVLFELWVFNSGAAQLSALRLLLTALAACVALGIRIVVVWLLGQVLGISLVEASITLLFGAAASLLVNYLIVRLAFASTLRASYYFQARRS